MKFYDCKPAPSPRRVRVFMAEKGIEIPTVQVDLRNGEHLTPDFRMINPHCTVPVPSRTWRKWTLPLERRAATQPFMEMRSPS